MIVPVDVGRWAYLLIIISGKAFAGLVIEDRARVGRRRVRR